MQYKSELWSQFRNVIPKILKQFLRYKKMRIFCSWKWQKPSTRFKVFKSYVKKISNAKNFHIFLDDISENCSLCCQGQQSYLCRPGQVHDEIWQFNCVFFPCCMFPNKKYWKKLQILKKISVWVPLSISQDSFEI